MKYNMDTKELGNLGEKLACEYLVKKGYKILGKNWRISFGEIDIIAVQKWRITNIFAKRAVHFIEVKTIADSAGFFPEQHANYKKQRKLKQLAQIWLQKNKYPQNIPYQIDIIGILVNQEKRSTKLHYFGNVVEGD